MEWFEQLGFVFFLGLTAGVALTILVATLIIRRQGGKLRPRITTADDKEQNPPA